MKIKSIDIKNFRLLHDVQELSFEEKVTLLVGRNNSGKTSLIDIFNKFVKTNRANFQIEDFSILSLPKFNESLKYWRELKLLREQDNQEDKVEEIEIKIRHTIPSISLKIYIEYSEDDNLSVLAPFIMDLDPQRKDACILFEYSPNDIEKLFLSFDQNNENDFLEFIKKNHRHFFSEKIFAIDSQSISIKRLIENKAPVTELLLTSFIYAQRHIDDQDLQSKNKLSKGFEEYYNDHFKDEQKSNELQNLLNETGETWDKQYKELFSTLLTDLKTFGYPGLSSHELTVKAMFEVDKIIKGNIHIFYNHSENNLLPESLNGLGFKNLIYIILKFVTFYEKYKSQKPTPGMHLIFIEEPEVHLHPQMQITFIRNIEHFINEKTGWNVQIIITTHSSHIVSESGFVALRYFNHSNSHLDIKSLREFKVSEQDNFDFLKQYMSLHRCDMFFADKVILIEGTVERLLLPEIINKIDTKHETKLKNQYISIIEVGGAYAQKFKEILKFINVKTLIITDIDSVSFNQQSNRYKKCPVSEGERTSNPALKDWLPGKEKINELLNCKDIDKTQEIIRVAYQVPELNGDKCGRSFEEAFILKNASLLANNKSLISTREYFKDKTSNEIIDKSYEIADKKIADNKTDFAFDLMLINNWEVPKYIAEGLLWLVSKE